MADGLRVPGLHDYPGHRPALRRPRAPQVLVVPPLPVLHGHGRHDLPMDVLGLLAGVLAHGGPLHRRPGQLRAEERAGRALARLRAAARDRLLPVPAALLRVHRADRHRRRLRARPHRALAHLLVPVGHHRLLPHRVLDVELQRLAIQPALARLRRRRPRAHRVGLVRAGVRLRARQAQARRRDDAPEAAQHHARLHR